MQASLIWIEESLCTGFDKVIKETTVSNGETTQTGINIDGIYLPGSQKIVCRAQSYGAAMDGWGDTIGGADCVVLPAVPHRAKKRDAAREETAVSSPAISQ